MKNFFKWLLFGPTTKHLIGGYTPTKGTDNPLPPVGGTGLKRPVTPFKQEASIKFTMDIEPNNEMEAFGAYLVDSYNDGRPKIRINFCASLLAAKDEGLDFKQMISRHAVHELIHVFQEIFDRAFSEDEVEEALDSVYEEIS